MTPAIEARRLRKTFRNEGVVVEALRGVDVAVEPGEFLAVMGPSGSGKSTLLHLLGGLDHPSEGEVLIDGRPLAALSLRALAHVRNRQVGFVFQFFNLMPSLTVAENVALPAVIDGQRESTWAPRVAELLELVGLSGHERRYPARLSGGEQQRVAIARALVMRPAVLLADEPTGNLDSASGEVVIGLLRRCHDQGQTIVLVSHDVKVASHAQRLVSMRDGLVVDDSNLEGVGPARLSRVVQLGGGGAGDAGDGGG